jgi:hypothetical protein
MQKISGILPANARVTTVDMKASGVARPGMPSWGREVGVPIAAEKKMQNDAAAKASFVHKEQMQLREGSAKDPHVAIVEKMAENFFVNRAAEPKAEIKDEPIIAADPNSDMDMMTGTPPLGLDSDDGDTLLVGQYLDVQA